MNQPESESESILAPFKRVGSKSRPQYTGKLRLIYPTTHPSEGFWIVRINKITNKIFNFHNLICGRFRLENRCFWYSISKFDCKSFWKSTFFMKDLKIQSNMVRFGWIHIAWKTCNFRSKMVNFLGIEILKMETAPILKSKWPLFHGW